MSLAALLAMSPFSLFFFHGTHSGSSLALNAHTHRRFLCLCFALSPPLLLSKKNLFVFRDTSGVLVMALNAGVHRTLSMAFEAREVDKTYIALVDAHLEHQVLK